MEKSTLELLFDRLHRNQQSLISRMLPEARAEYNVHKDLLTKDERRKVNFIRSLLDYCASERWGQARNQLEPAEEEYQRYFYRKLRSTTPSKQTPRVTWQNSALVKEYPPQVSRPGTQGSRQSGTEVKQQKGLLSEEPASEAMRQSRMFGQTTDMSDLSSSDKIVDKFSELFQNEWGDAMDELEHLKILTTHAISCLFRIVLDAYKVCIVEANNQISKLEEAASDIVMEGGHRTDDVNGNRHYLVQYRHGIAAICLERLQEMFRRRYLPEIIRSGGVYQNIRTHGAMQRYVDQCVAICWAMAVLDPQVYMVDDRNNQRLFNADLYNTYTKSGPSVGYYVWPPLTREKGGKLLTKGYAQGR